jgi:NAD(P)-dependent dehydrogenase (short-subunit alcohol dehydrogenase family)
MMEKKYRPAQKQKVRPGKEHTMHPKPKREYTSSPKLMGKVALITGGDSGIGAAVAVAFAKEGADVAILYLKEHRDAKEVEQEVIETGSQCLRIACDVGKEADCKKAVNSIIKKFGRLDIVVNNAAEQHPKDSIKDITQKQLEKVFRTNIFSYFYIVKASLDHMKKGSCIINTTSVTAYRGSPHLLDYASTKGAIVAFTRSLAMNLVEKGIRVNAVAPGPIWTPLIPSTFPKRKVVKFGTDTPMKRAGEPSEVAPCFVFLACESDSSYITGQVLHPNGGEILNT